MRESYRVNWRGVAKHNVNDWFLGKLHVQDVNGWFLAEELCQTDPLLVQKYEERLIIEADSGPTPLITGVQAKTDTSATGEGELDIAAMYSAVPIQAQERNERRIESLVDFMMNQESPIYFGLTRDEVKTRIEHQAKSDLMADVYHAR